MARAQTGLTWAPTAAGQVVLFGVKSSIIRGEDRGYLVLMAHTAKYRELFHGVEEEPGVTAKPALATKVRIADGDAKGGHRLIPRVLPEDRGTWKMEDGAEPSEKTIILSLKGQEFARFTLLPEYHIEKPSARVQEFVPVDDL